MSNSQLKISLFRVLYLIVFATICESTVAAQESPKVVVVGAGLSGLTTAYYLKENGVQAEIYEARNRVGGRVFTVYQNGHLVELGGQNISDGEEAHNILTLIDELGLETETNHMIAQLTYFDKGQATDVGELLDKQAFNSQELGNKLEKLEETSENMKEVLQGLFNKNNILLKATSVLMSADEGAPTDKLSSIYSEALYDLLLENSTKDNDDADNYIENLMVKGGNGLIAERLAKKLSGHLHLNHALKGISKNPDGSYLLTFNNGPQVNAEILILSIPCPVFKNITADNNVIPAERLKTIKQIEYGTNAKIIVPIVPPSEEIGSITNGRALTFFNRDKFALTLLYVDQFGRFNAQTIGDTFQKDVPMIERFFKLNSPGVPILARDEAFSSYTKAVGHSWPNDQFALGSYSCIGVGQEEEFTSTTKVDGETVKTLFAPIDGTLFFCGEHTSIVSSGIGTMEAAVESGIRTGKMVSKKIPITQED